MTIHGVHFLVAAALVLSACGTDDDTGTIGPNTTDPVRTTTAIAPISTVIAPAAPKATLPVVVGVGDRVRATIPVENTADSIAIADDAVWVAGWDGQLVSRIDVDTNEVVTVDVGSTGTRVSSGKAGVWVGVDGGQVLRLDPLTAQVVATLETGGVVRRPVERRPGGVGRDRRVFDVDTRRPGDQRGDGHNRRGSLGHSDHSRCGDR